MITPKRTLVLILAVASSAPLVIGQLLGGSPCSQNDECASRLCTVPFAGPGDRQCIDRPAPVSASCAKELEATDCDTGYCSEDTLKCDRKPTGTPCSGNNQCQPEDICAQTVGNNQGLFCLATGLDIGIACNVNEQCASNNCPAPFYQCREPGDDGDDTVSIERPEDQPCQFDTECASGICDDKIANDGFAKVCLKGPDLPLGVECSTDRQCFSQYCVPQSAPTEQKPLTCADRPADPIIDDGGGNDTGTGGGDNGNDTGTGGSGGADNSNGGNTGGGSTDDGGSSNEVFTTIIVENGQTRTTVATRTVTVRSSNRASASTARVSANASSTPSNAAAKLDGHRAKVIETALLVIAVRMLGL